jgi:hypothetical protein
MLLQVYEAAVFFSRHLAIILADGEYFTTLEIRLGNLDEDSRLRIRVQPLDTAHRREGQNLPRISYEPTTSANKSLLLDPRNKLFPGGLLRFSTDLKAGHAP